LATRFSPACIQALTLEDAKSKYEVIETQVIRRPDAPVTSNDYDWCAFVYLREISPATAEPKKPRLIFEPFNADLLLPVAPEPRVREIFKKLEDELERKFLKSLIPDLPALPARFPHWLTHDFIGAAKKRSPHWASAETDKAKVALYCDAIDFNDSSYPLYIFARCKSHAATRDFRIG
jgi:hypothetical protein